MNQIRNQVQTSALNTVQAVRDTARAAVTTWAFEHVENASNWAANEIIRAAAKALLAHEQSSDALNLHPAQTQMRQLLTPIMSTLGYEGYFLISRDGLNLASSRTTNVGIPGLLRMQEAFLERIWKGEGAVSVPQPSDVPLADATGTLRPGRETMFVGAPVRDADGQIIAAFAFRVDPFDGFIKFLLSARFGETGESYAINSEGLLLSESRFEGELVQLGLLPAGKSAVLTVRAAASPSPTASALDIGALTQAAKAVQAGQTGRSEAPYLDYRGTEVIGAWTWIPELGFGIITEIEKREAFAAYHVARSIMIPLLVFLTLTTAYLIYRYQSHLGRTEVAKNSSEARLRAILSNVLDAIITIDKQGTIRNFNPAAETMFGYSHLEVLGKNVSILMPDSDAQQHDHYVSSYLNGGKPSIIGNGREVTGRRKDGSIFPMWLGVSDVDIQGRQVFVGVARDITDQKLAEAELNRHREHLEEILQQRTSALSEAVTALEEEVAERRKAENQAHYANRAKSEFLANMSHELRTPLNAILGFSEIIEKRIFGDRAIGRYTEYASDIRESGEHLLDIINDILDLAKVEAGEMEVEESVVDPVILVEACIRLTRDRAEASGLKVVAEHGSPTVKLFADERKLKQVLINLLANAVKFTDRGGKITVASRVTPDGGFELDVIDTGVGIAREDIDKVLSPFGQADTSLSRDSSGTGLGLPLVKSLVELHGGKLEIDSEVGVGTTLRVILPASRVGRPARVSSMA